MPLTRCRLAAATIATALLGCTLTLLPALPASAHVSATSTTNEAGSYAVVTFSIPHGCDGSATTTLSIQMPEGIDAVTPTRHPFYDIEVVTETLDEPIVDSHGNEITTRVAEVLYTANDPLPDGYRDAVELSLQLPEEAAGSTLYFPTVQTCEQGETAWVEIPAEGQDPHELAAPAPAVEVLASSTDTHGDGTEESAAAPEPGVTATESPALSIVALAVAAVGLAAAVVVLLRGRRRE